MFVVVTDIERHPVDRPVITKRLLVRIERVVLLNPAGAHRMETDGKQKRKPKIPESEPAADEVNGDDVAEDGEDVPYRPGIPHGDCFQTRWPGELKNREEEKPERFPVPFVADEARLPLVGDVGVHFVMALMGMMLEMVNPEGNRGREEIGQIGEDRDQLVQESGAKDKIMGGVVDDHISAMIGERAEAVSKEKADPPAIGTEAAHPKGDRALNRNHQQPDQRREGIAAHEGTDFGMGLEDRARSLWMRLFEVGLVEFLLHR